MMQKPLSSLSLMPFLILLASGLSGQSPSAEREARAGNDAYDEGEAKKALEHYEKAMKKGMGSSELRFNKGDALYQLEKYADAARSFERVAQNSEQKSLRAKAYHNKGNAFLKAGKLDKSIEAYKEALRIDPSDEETRYNLALAKKLKKKQQKKQKKDQKQQKKKKDQKKKGEQKQQQKGNGNKKSGQKNKNKQGGKKEQNKKKQQKGSKKGKQKQGKKKPRALSPKEVKRLLKAIRSKEAKVQRKVLRKKKGQKAKSKEVEKDW